MCGIAGIYLKNKKAGSDEGMSQMADALLCEIEHRGKHATGFVSIGWDKSVVNDKSDKTASEFIKEREPFQKGVQAVLLHTRWWTKGKPEIMGNNHPVTSGTCFTVHNGSIGNDDELFKDEKLERLFQVDSEIIPAMLDKYGMDHPDHIRTALEKLEGAMAIAAIDPIKHPTRLLLARGSSSPLHIFENQNVIVWASEHSAIKDAWGKVIGTPPHASKIKYVQEGKFFIADDYKELGVYDFTPKKRVYHYSPTNRPTGDARSIFGGSRSMGMQPTRPWDSNGCFNTRKEYDDALREHRQTSEKRARTWSMRSSYDDATDFADVKGNISWYNCICGQSILKEDMIDHLKYGKICIDCAAVISVQYQGVAAKAAEEERENRETRDDPIKRIKIPTLTTQDQSNLESWSLRESLAHRYTLNDLSDRSGLSILALDYLIFRTDAVAADFGTAVTAAKFALKRLYEALRDQLEVDFGKELSDEADHQDEITPEIAQEIAEGMFYPWFAYAEKLPTGQTRIKYVCEDHGEQFAFGDHCLQCADEDGDNGRENSLDAWADVNDEACESDSGACGVIVEAQEIMERKSPMEKCPECRTWIIGECTLCAERKEAVKALKEAVVESCCCKATRDRKCRNKLAIIATSSLVGKKLGYCTRHWTKCSEGKCNGDANFTALDGKRYCHKHARRKSGISDKSATSGGETLVIEEVR